MRPPLRRRRHSRPLVIALYLNATLLVAILAVLVTRGGASGWPDVLPAAYANDGGAFPQPIAGAGNVYLMPGQMSMNTWGVYVMDVDRQTLCAYQFKPGEKQLHFVAARNFTHDLRLKAFNTTPDPEEIRDWGDRERQGARGVALKPRAKLRTTPPPADDGTIEDADLRISPDGFIEGTDAEQPAVIKEVKPEEEEPPAADGTDGADDKGR